MMNVPAPARAQARQSEQSSARHESASRYHHGSSPSRNAAASARSRDCRKTRSAGARSTSRPWCRNRTSSAEAARLSEVVRHHHDLRSRQRAIAATMRSISCVAPGIEARGRLVEEQHLRVERPRAGEREALLLAAGEHARRTIGECAETDAGRARAGRGGRARRRARRRLQRVDDVGERRAAQHHRPLEHHRLAARARAADRANSRRRGPTVGASSPWQRRSSTLLPAPFGPTIIVRGPASMSNETPCEDPARAGVEDDVARARAAAAKRPRMFIAFTRSVGAPHRGRRRPRR